MLVSKLCVPDLELINLYELGRCVCDHSHSLARGFGVVFPNVQIIAELDSYRHEPLIFLISVMLSDRATTCLVLVG